MERFIDVPGGRRFAVGEGDGPPIVLAHAAIADLRAWDAMIPGLVGAGFRVVRYDYRAFGRSTTDVVDFSNRADLVAVVAVVGVGAGLGGCDGEPTPEELAVFKAAEQTMSAAEPDLDAIADLAVRIWVDGPGQPPDRVDWAIRESVRAMCRPLGEPGRVRGRPIPLQPPANDRLSELRCPVLAVAGTLDVSDVVQTAQRLEAAAPNARAVVWPDVAHMIGMEAPDRLNALILDFLAPLRPWD